MFPQKNLAHKGLKKTLVNITPLPPMEQHLDGLVQERCNSIANDPCPRI